MCQTNKKTNRTFAELGTPERVWAIPAIHGETELLMNLHDILINHFQRGDKIVYMGNYTGYNVDAAGCIDEILTFRRLLLCMRGVLPSDIIYLRGAQEEIWQKLIQLQFAPDPLNVLSWMLDNGLAPTLESYDLCPHDAIEACNKGIMAITKWTEEVRRTIKAHPGHDTFSAQHVRAAYTDQQSAYPLLFVHAGIDCNKALESQGDSFWWAGHQFSQIETEYNPFKKIVRGYDPDHHGINLNCVTATIDDGCGFGGSLVCAGFDMDGQAVEMLEI